MKYEKRPVSSIHYDDKRASIPDIEHQGEEAGVVENEEKQSEYDIFRHEFQRGRDPELYWLDKYKNDDEDTQMPQLRTDIRSLYTHEDVRPEAIIDSLYELHVDDHGQPMLDLFGDTEPEPGELERLAGYYQHNDNWKNRLIQGDSLLVMNSLLNREGMKGQVQCVYFDPPYGIRYGGNWQIMIGKPKMSHESKDNELSGEPEMIKAYRDTWELGIHSYLSYLRDRLVVARELLNETGSCFIQISDENVHLVRCVLDEVFGSENFIDQIIYQKTTGAGSPGDLIAPASICDYILWYAKDKEKFKFRPLYIEKSFEKNGADGGYSNIELEDGSRMTISQWEKINNQRFSYPNRPLNSKIFTMGNLTSQSGGDIGRFDIEYKGHTYKVHGTSVWKTSKQGIENLKKKNRLHAFENGTLRYVRYFEDFPYQALSNLWTDTSSSLGTEKIYVVQSGLKAIQRCILMSTDPGDLVLDPTCGSGTTAYLAEQWGRRWITIDTSRIALNIAKTRLISAVYPYYVPFDKNEKPNIRLGFNYKKVSHVTLKALANNLPLTEEVLYDQPEVNKKRIRVSGPFTVETLQSLDVLAPESVAEHNDDQDEYMQFMDRIFDNLKSNGIRNGRKDQQVIMHSMEHVDEPYLNAKGYYKDAKGDEHCVYFMVGPKFGTVSKHAVNEAIRAFRNHLSESNWLCILGFSFGDEINMASEENKDYNFGTFQVSKVRMSDDLLQDGLIKKDKKAGSFIIIGEPDVSLVKDTDGRYHVEINGMDMYDPIHDDVKARSTADIAYWEMDDEYKGSLFKVRSIHFCGGDKKEFKAWRKGLETIDKDYVKKSTKKKAEFTLRLKFNDEIWDRLYDYKSEPIEYRQGRKIAVRVVSQFGEEATKILEMK
ncbi:MAG: site-specific DNA-methyltransferase [Prevotella sp.]|jgi:adenine-specific DNA-methyltransferase